jgi:CBS domain containing-hemolysin-like protein
LAAWLLLVSLVLIAVCGLFVAGEFAFLTADRATVERAAQAGDRKARGVLAALRNLSVELSGVQVAITLTNLAVGFLSEPALAGLLHAPLRAIGIRGDALSAIAIAVSLAVSTLLTMLFGEMVPKNLAIAMPFAVARAVQAPVRGFSRAMRVPLRGLNGIANWILKLFGLEARDELPSARSAEELMSLVRHSARAGTLAPGTASLLVRSLTLGDRRARDVLTPRPQMVTVTRSDPITHVLDTVQRTGHSRLPVTGPDGLDEIVGIVEVDQAVAVPAARRAQVPAGDVMGPTVEVPESLPMDAVLQTLQNRRSQLAIVVDEYGGTAGLLSAEDILEELVGELDDEHDAPAPATRVVPEGYELSGLLRPDEVAAATGHPLPSSGMYETVGGLLMHLLGRIPREGDRVDLDGVSLTVIRMANRRVDRVLLRVSDGSDA